MRVDAKLRGWGLLVLLACAACATPIEIPGADAGASFSPGGRDAQAASSGDLAGSGQWEGADRQPPPGAPDAATSPSAGFGDCDCAAADVGDGAVDGGVADAACDGPATEAGAAQDGGSAALDRAVGDGGAVAH